MDISYDYIRGLVEGEGCFTFCGSHTTRAGEKIKIKIPAFAISMHERDEYLLNLVKNKLKLSNKVYNYRNTAHDHIIRGRRAVLIVRDIGALKNVIVPLFYKKLIGNKRGQFEEWINKIGADPDVPKLYKILYQLYNCDFYDNNYKNYD